MLSLIDSFLGSHSAVIVGRSIISSFFLIAGIFGIFNFGVIVSEMKSVSLPSPEAFAVATIATQLIGSILLISNVAGLAWLGAGILAVFTLLCIPVGHPFWTFDEPRRTHEFQIALEHIALTGGLLLAAIASR